MATPHVLILGGGYGGLACLRALSRHLHGGEYTAALLDATPHHTIKTRFHERAVWERRELLLRVPLPPLARAAGATFVQDRITALNLKDRRVEGKNGSHPYDRLVLALGGNIAYFDVPGAAEHTVSLQTYEDASACGRRLAALDASGRSDLRVAVCGAGVEGLEVAAMVRQRLPARRCEVVVLERSTEVLARSLCRPAQREYLRDYLRRREIELRLGATIQGVTEQGVTLDGGEMVGADLVYWCAGVRRVDLPGTAAGEPFRVNPYLQAEEHPEVFALGDFATVQSDQEFANLASAQRAVYLGTLAARNLWNYDHLRLLRPVRYRPIGELIGLGDLDGVGIVYGVGVTGKTAGALKKANEVKYLAELCGGLPGSFLRRLTARPPAS
ncbi:MAG: FAD-dependent oxidoreductase [Deferrisomatales bacterium]|nr:FAD-dependent oxidoreductase [Deferrisomatales bacterium]